MTKNIRKQQLINITNYLIKSNQVTESRVVIGKEITKQFSVVGKSSSTKNFFEGWYWAAITFLRCMTKSGSLLDSKSAIAFLEIG